MNITERERRSGWLQRSVVVSAGLILAALAMSMAVACNDDDKNDSTPTEPAATTSATSAPSGNIDYSSLGGSIRIDGSSTVYPISEAMAEEFGKVAGTDVNVAFSGTGGGFEKFCAGEIQISDASRPIKQEETDACAANNITDVIEFQVAIDALTVVVNPANDFVDCLTVDQLAKLFGDTSVTKWSDIDPAWPSDSISFYYPGTDSGTFDYFNEAVVATLGETATHRGDGTASEDDNVLAVGVENDQNAIGYFGLAYFEDAGSELRAVPIDNGSGCIAPSSQTALDGTYAPLSRPLFIYTRTSFLQDTPEILGFVNFYLENSNEIVPQVSYVQMSDALLQEQTTKLEPFLP